jgi:hypothetical protein
MIWKDGVFRPKPAIDCVTREVASIVIESLPSTVIRADRIVAAADPETVEDVDCHAEILAENKTYGLLYRLRLAEGDACGSL